MRKYDDEFEAYLRRVRDVARRTLMNKFAGGDDIVRILSILIDKYHEYLDRNALDKEVDQTDFDSLLGFGGDAK